MVSSPNLAFFHMEPECILPSRSSPRKFHDLVVCNFLPLFKNTDTTPGCSAIFNIKIPPVSLVSFPSETHKKKRSAKMKLLNWIFEQLLNLQVQQQSHWYVSYRSRKLHLWPSPYCEVEQTIRRNGKNKIWNFPPWNGNLTYLPKNDPRNSKWESVTLSKSTSLAAAAACEWLPRYTTYD